MDDTYFDDVWTAYFHNSDDQDWTLGSYANLGPISCVRDYWHIFNVIEPHLTDGMFFVHRDGIQPCWDDIGHRDGGCVSVKVPREHTGQEFALLTRRLIGETLLGGPDADSMHRQITGISVSPKRQFCIVKVWLSGLEIGPLELPRSRVGDPLYTPFRAHIMRSAPAPAAVPIG